MKEALDNNKQVILYLDNKSYSTVIKCRECGHVLRCTKCKIPLVLHKEKKVAKCNYCNSESMEYHVCEKCGSTNINSFGFGLEKVKEVVSNYFPDKTILQIDSDILTTTEDYEKAIIDIEDGNVDIIIGTNILNKRINNSNIGLVAILSADRLLNSNDYRANEFTYSNIAKLINYDNLNFSSILLSCVIKSDII